MRIVGIFLLTLASCYILAQNETKFWYFGYNAGLNFNTNPPTVLTNGALSSDEGCATISDANGNLLFYTNGVTIWNMNHVPMANGAGLFGNISTTQSSLIAKKPGSNNLYYVFTLGAYGTGSLCYSIVDMNLAAGVGSVTVKNITLATNCSEKMTATKHCNGTDIWIVVHEYQTSVFKSFLLSNSGVNLTPVNSAIGSVHSHFIGSMKASPNGRKLGLVIFGLGSELFDFDITSGTVTNSLVLLSNPQGGYGCEFSSDGTKFYAHTSGDLYQFDLCATNNSGILASQYLVFSTASGAGSMQLSSNGKIYFTENAVTSNSLGVINNPNSYSAACNYSAGGLSIAPETTLFSIPNFVTSYFRKPPPTFSYVQNCMTFSFTPQCLNTTYSIVNTVWDFGDPASGLANTSALLQASHTYSTSGTYTCKLILNYSCGGGSDTLVQVLSIPAPPVVNVAGSFTICAGQTSAFSAIGANTYSWSTGALGSSISVSPPSTAAYSVIGTNTLSNCSASTTFTVFVSKCVGYETHEMQNALLFKTFPNPAKDFINIETSTSVELKIFDLLGRQVFTSVFDRGTHQLCLHFLNNGTYFVVGSNGENKIVLKLLKINE